MIVDFEEYGVLNPHQEAANIRHGYPADATMKVIKEKGSIL